jgi:hypothetical protein
VESVDRVGRVDEIVAARRLGRLSDEATHRASTRVPSRSAGYDNDVSTEHLWTRELPRPKSARTPSYNLGRVMPQPRRIDTEIASEDGDR